MSLSPDKPLLDVRGMTIGFGGKEVVHGVDFQIRAGERANRVRARP